MAEDLGQWGGGQLVCVVTKYSVNITEYSVAEHSANITEYLVTLQDGVTVSV